jgi:hypothetical protein
LGQFGQVIGLTIGQVRAIIRARRIPYVEIGRRFFIPKAAIPRFIEENTVQPCRDEIQDHVCASSKNEVVFTSAGPKLAAAGSAARVRHIADKLKSSLPSSSASGRGPKARVIPLKPL